MRAFGAKLDLIPSDNGLITAKLIEDLINKIKGIKPGTKYILD